MTRVPELEFFYDCSSPWTYFAFTRIIPLTEELAVPVRWRPILVGGVFNAVNQQVYAAREALFSEGEESPKLRYYLQDLGDWAQFCGVQLQWPPGHPVNSVKAMRGAIFAAEQDLLVPYSRAVFETYWGGRNPDIASDAVLAAICDQVGLNRDSYFAAINHPNYKDRLRANTDELIARGGFGSPTLFVDGDDMYFGNDRLPLVEYRLRQKLS